MKKYSWLICALIPGLLLFTTLKPGPNGISDWFTGTGSFLLGWVFLSSIVSLYFSNKVSANRSKGAAILLGMLTTFVVYVLIYYIVPIRFKDIWYESISYWSTGGLVLIVLLITTMVNSAINRRQEPNI